MFKRISWGLALVCALALLTPILGASNASAQSKPGNSPLYTYVAQWGVPRAQWDDMAKARQAATGVFDTLLADGTITGYGSLEMIVHDESGYTHANWWEASSYAGILKAHDAVLPASTGKDSPYNSSKHMDLLLQSLAHGGKAGASGKGILWVATYELKDGSADDFTRLFKAVIQPLFEEQVAAGNVLSYSLDEEVVHSPGPHMVSIVYMLPDGAALDRFRAAQRANREKNPFFGDSFNALTVGKGHSDLFATATFKSK